MLLGELTLCRAERGDDVYPQRTAQWIERPGRVERMSGSAGPMPRGSKEEVSAAGSRDPISVNECTHSLSILECDKHSDAFFPLWNLHGI